MSRKVVIVGGVAGGASAAARLRRLDEFADIILLERGRHISFANCGLPYFIGGEIRERSALMLQTPESFRARFRVDVRVEHEALSIDREAKSVRVRKLGDGSVYTEAYDYLVLSPGAEPIRPELPGLDSDRVFTLRNIPDTYRIRDFIDQREPKSAVVVGGGYIGVEMAENLHRAGLDVTIAEAQDQLLPPFDYDMACDLHHHVTGKGVTLRLNSPLRSVEETEDGLLIRAGEHELAAGMLVLAIGVRPESGLALGAGLELGERGGILVDKRMRTADPAIFAVGDAVEVLDYVTGRPAMIPLAGPANRQGRIAADNICGIGGEYTGTQGSAIVKVFDMTAASTGINEKTARKLELDYEKSFTYSASHAGYYPNAMNMSVKLLYEKGSGKILGAQLTGFDGVDKRCDVLATAIRFGATVRDLTQQELCYAPPYSSAKDPVNMAGFVAENHLAGKAEPFHWHDVPSVLADETAVLLDVRTPGEYKRGFIEGSVNIPLDNLRERLGELDKAKTCYVLCQVGLRGYVACRILSQRGFACKNLSGGYRLIRSIYGDLGPQPPDPIGVGPEASSNR